MSVHTLTDGDCVCVHTLVCMCKGIRGGHPCCQGEGGGEVIVERVRVRVRVGTSLSLSLSPSL